MPKTLFWLITLTLSGLFIASPGLATPKKRFDPGTETCRLLNFYNSGWVSEGSKIFKNSCQNCHYKGNDRGAVFLHSETKTMKGWNRVFLDKYPPCAKDGSWDGLSQQELLKLNDYLYRNAANTYDANDADDCG